MPAPLGGRITGLQDRFHILISERLPLSVLIETGMLAQLLESAAGGGIGTLETIPARIEACKEFAQLAQPLSQQPEAVLEALLPRADVAAAPARNGTPEMSS